MRIVILCFLLLAQIYPQSFQSILVKPKGNYSNQLCGEARVLEEIEQIYNSYTNSWENYKRSTYDYSTLSKPSNSNSIFDEEGYYTEYTSTWQNNDWQQEGKIEYGYDGNGFLVRRSDYEYNLSGYLQSGLILYENDTYGNNTYGLEQAAIDGQFYFYKQWHALIHVGQLTLPYTNEKTTEYWIDGEWKETNRTLWEYENDCITSETSFWKDGDNWIPSAQTNFIYEYGCIADMTQYCIPKILNGHNPSKVHWLIYNIDTNEFEEFLIEETLEDDFLYANNVRLYPMKTTSYNQLFEPIAQQRMEYQDDSSVLKTKSTNDVNDLRLTKWEVHNWINGGWEASQRVLFTYEGMGLDTDNNNSQEQYKMELKQNFPNPFNPNTSISYDISKENSVRLTVYDLLGSEIVQLVNQTEQPGSKVVQWDGRNQKGELVNGGVYLYKLEIGGYIETKKMVMLK